MEKSITIYDSQTALSSITSNPLSVIWIKNDHWDSLKYFYSVVKDEDMCSVFDLIPFQRFRELLRTQKTLTKASSLFLNRMQCRKCKLQSWSLCRENNYCKSCFRGIPTFQDHCHCQVQYSWTLPCFRVNNSWSKIIIDSVIFRPVEFIRQHNTIHEIVWVHWVLLPVRQCRWLKPSTPMRWSPWSV